AGVRRFVVEQEAENLLPPENVRDGVDLFLADLLNSVERRREGRGAHRRPPVDGQPFVFSLHLLLLNHGGRPSSHRNYGDSYTGSSSSRRSTASRICSIARRGGSWPDSI